MQKHTVDRLVLGSIETNCWLCPLPAEGPQNTAGKESRPCALIDPGAEPETIIARMETLNLYPRYILLTHGHFDHLAALPALFSHYRGGPEIAIHRDDAGYLGPGAYQVHRASFTAAAGNASYVDSLWEDMPSPSRLLGDGDTIGPFRVIHLPGHTPGSAGFLFDGSRSGPGKPGEKLIFSGDTLFRAGVGRTDLPGGDLNRLRESLMRFLAMDEEINVYPGHGPVTSVGEEKAFWSHGL